MTEINEGATLADVKAEADATAAELAKHEALDTEAAKAAATPSLGRIVHVRAKDGSIHPGIITRVHEEGPVDVQVFTGDHMIHAAHRQAVVSIDSKTAGWFWPPKV